ncbi:helix-turn-helix domain-containing protein [Tsukamurella paurometabola]|uniref:HTH-type transcriptional regulator sinR n=1 Tax=Tsukamurella paurometabola TaxID=2061 RepID=A0A3P8MF33_TSUPA|nr:helix-turn-helix transcriptional regulator [Tsukamurella paurometabola]MBS4101687.1 helix-turn-helix transcriptional regulator [Tsukamurella paurometabola]UEA84249.1 helix-turn-helix transcriptional regulator [Tsukamurella paurometabola]VDR41423.1 HTH-type transcriptional regulator sinR [Tsukamurella paurometabola]
MRTHGEALFRHELGAHLRRLRHERGERLADTAERAGISPQYLSEIERGLKDPSSEMLAAIAGALGTGVGPIVVEVGRRLDAARPVLRLDRTATAVPAAGPVAPMPSTPGPRLLALAA